MYTIYGIKNCDTVKKAINWFKEKDLPFSFYDYRIEGLSKKTIQEWIDAQGSEQLLNKKSLSWRNLPPDEQKKASSKKGTADLLFTHLTLIKRPVITSENKIVTIGFDEAVFRERYKKPKAKK